MSEARGPQPTADPGGKPKERVSLLWFATALLRERRVILVCTAVGIVVSAVIALLLQTTFTTTFSFLPQATQDQGRAGLPSVAGQFGISRGALGGAKQSPQHSSDRLIACGVLGPIAADSVPLGADGAQRTLRKGCGAERDVADRTDLANAPDTQVACAKRAPLSALVAFRPVACGV